MVEIAISVLNADLSNIADLCSEIDESTASSIQIDVMDGHFVPHLALGPQDCAAFAMHSRLPIEAHLMVKQPERFLETFATAGATYLIAHTEVLPDIPSYCNRVRSLGKRPGIAINPETPPDKLLSVCTLADLIVVMGVHPGAGGQSFISSTLQTLTILQSARQQAGSSLPKLQLDGGVNTGTVQQIVAAGADAVIGGSFVMRHPQGIKAGVQMLKTHCRKK